MENKNNYNLRSDWKTPLNDRSYGKIKQLSMQPQDVQWPSVNSCFKHLIIWRLELEYNAAISQLTTFRSHLHLNIGTKMTG